MRPLETGRVLEHDEKSRAFPAPTAKVHSWLWVNDGPRLDQRHRRACEGYAMAHVLNTKPVHRRGEHYLADAEALGLYGWATRLDDFHGNTYPDHDLGTSSLGVAKAALQLGKIERYEWGFGFDHALETFMHGPCIVGGDWYEDMSHPNTKGFVTASGGERGGHAWEWLGLNLEAEYIIGRNSWGRFWGLRGCFRLPFPDFRRILEHQGDVLLPIRATMAA